MFCEWREDEDGIWWAECQTPKWENAFVFNEGGPSENNFRFCPYCAMPIFESPYSEDAE